MTTPNNTGAVTALRALAACIRKHGTCAPAALEDIADTLAATPPEGAPAVDGGDAVLREVQTAVINALAAIVGVHTPDALYDLDAIPREPVMDQVRCIKSAMDRLHSLAAAPAPAVERTNPHIGSSLDDFMREEGITPAEAREPAGDADTKRLDWLDAHEYDLRHFREPAGDDEYSIWCQITHGRKSISGHPVATAREAIDAAMQSPTGEPT